MQKAEVIQQMPLVAAPQTEAQAEEAVELN